MGITVSRKKANKFSRQAKRLTYFDGSRKMEKNVTVSRKSYYPIETLIKQCLTLSCTHEYQ